MNRLATRFALLMAAAAIVPLLAYGLVSIVSVRSGAQQAVIEGNLNVARQVAERIELYVANSVTIMHSVAANLQQTGLQPWQQDRVLKNFVLDFPEFRELTLLDEHGTPRVSSRLGTPTTDIPGPSSMHVHGALMSPFAVDDDLLPTSVIAVRLADPDARGWLVGRLNLEQLWRMVDSIRVGSGGYALLITQDGQLLAHGNPDEKPQVARGLNLREHPLVRRAWSAAGPEGVGWAQYTSDTGTPMLGVAARLPHLGWTVMVEQPVADAFAIPRALQQQLGIAIGAALFAMLTVGYYWGRSFIRPILRLTRGTRALAEGRLQERVPIESADEVGQLGLAFNNMADRLAELQEDVRKKERQAMFGRIAVGLVHDLSNPVQNIGNSCKMMVRLWDDLDYRATFTRTVEQELAQVKRVLDDLRNVARPIPLTRSPLDVNRALADVIESTQPTAATAGLTIESDFAFGPLYIEGDLFALTRVSRNLIMNALQATPPQGRVMVRTRRQDDHAIIEIADNGCGIAADRLDTIFEDFVTTKRQGLGLGLAISKKIVEQLDGTIGVMSTVNVGSTFTLRFPLTRARPTQLAAG